MNKVDKVLWKYMIDNGDLGKWSFYGGSFDNDQEKRKCLDKDLKSSYIDWTKTKPIKSESEAAFTDTFHDAEYIDVMSGTLYFANGNKYDFGSTSNVIDVITEMAEYITDPFIVRELEDE